FALEHQLPLGADLRRGRLPRSRGDRLLAHRAAAMSDVIPAPPAPTGVAPSEPESVRIRKWKIPSRPGTNSPLASGCRSRISSRPTASASTRLQGALPESV